MKKTLVLSFLLLAMVTLSFRYMANPGELNFETEKRDFGKIPQNKPVSFDFKFTNTGDEPIIIASVEPACGCTVAKFTATPVKKGETGTISLTFNAAVTGIFGKSAMVKSNARMPVKTLYLIGEVVQAPASTTSGQ